MLKRAMSFVFALICLLFLSVAGSAAAHEQAITVVSRVSLSASDISAEDSLDILGVGTVAEPNLLRVVWNRVANAWGFALWRLELHGSTSLFAGEWFKLPVEKLSEEQGLVVLAVEPPEAGREYEVTLSYAADVGLLSISLVDITQGRVGIYAEDLRIAPQQAPLPLAAQPVASSAVALIKAAPYFVPVGTAWVLSTATAGVGSRTLTNGAAALLYLQSGQPADATYRLAADAGGEEYILWTGQAGKETEPIPVSTHVLPVGPVDIELEYVQNGTVWPLGGQRRYDVFAGSLKATIESVSYVDHSITGRAQITTDTSIQGLPLQLNANISLLQNGAWQPYAQQPKAWNQILEMDEAGAVSLPFTFAVSNLQNNDVRVEFTWEIAPRPGWNINAPSGTHEFAKLPEPWQSPIPVIDISTEYQRRSIVDHVPGQYLGHPDTVLMADGRTIFAVYPLGHGGPTVLRRSDDQGKTWSDRLVVPESWGRTANVPTIFRLTDPEGVERLIMFNNMARVNEADLPGRGSNDLHQSISTDGGKTWTELRSSGIWTPVAPNTVVPLSGSRYLTVFQLDGRIEQSISSDGGQTWSAQRTIAYYPQAQLTEPALIVSPDGKQLAVLIRENTRKFNSMLIVSNDEGKTWSQPVELPDVLTGDRHMPKYAPDGRLVITFRDRQIGSPTYADFVAWVGTYDDLVNLRDGDYRVRILQNLRQDWDTGYAGLEVLPDGTLVSTTYVPLAPNQRPSVVSVRFSLPELDAMLAD